MLIESDKALKQCSPQIIVLAEDLTVILQNALFKDMIAKAYFIICF